MRVLRKYFVEEPDGHLTPYRETRFKKFPVDEFGRVGLGPKTADSFFLDGRDIRPTPPYADSLLAHVFPWMKTRDEIFLLVRGMPSSVPHIRDFPNVQRMADALVFSSNQMALHAKSKKTSLYLRSGTDLLMLLLAVGGGVGLGAVIMAAIQQAGH